jgi:hypothetical protein
MLRKGRHSKLWEYLESSGVLEKGSDEEIKAVKRAYWKQYFLEYKRKQRISKPEYTVYFSKENGEHTGVCLAAKQHKLTVTAFIQEATLGYLRNTYIVPDKIQIARLEQLLSDCLNEIKTIVKPREKYFWERDNKMEAIERRIEKLEMQINEVFRNPPLISHDRQNKIA